jgi:hypothetical protein
MQTPSRVSLMGEDELRSRASRIQPPNPASRPLARARASQEGARLSARPDRLYARRGPPGARADRAAVRREPVAPGAQARDRGPLASKRDEINALDQGILDKSRTLAGEPGV